MTMPLPNFETCEIIEVETMENKGLESTNNLGFMWCSKTLEHLGLPLSIPSEGEARDLSR